MAVLTEGNHAGEFIVGEESIDRRKIIVVVSGAGVLPAGAVLGKITASGKYTIYDEAAVDGTEDAAGILFDEVDATSADADGIMLDEIVVVNNAELDWNTQDAAAQTAALVDLAVTHVTVKGA